MIKDSIAHINKQEFAYVKLDEGMEKNRSLWRRMVCG